MVERSLCMREASGSNPDISKFVFLLLRIIHIVYAYIVPFLLRLELMQNNFTTNHRYYITHPGLYNIVSMNK